MTQQQKLQAVTLAVQMMRQATKLNHQAQKMIDALTDNPEAGDNAHFMIDATEPGSRKLLPAREIARQVLAEAERNSQ